MYLGLSIIGFLLTLAGAVMIAYGIPNHAFGLGNTLIIAGTVAFAGGLILVGIANAVKQLKQIAESLIIYPQGRPQIDDLSGPASTTFANPPAASARIPFPPKPEPRKRAAAVPTEAPVDMAALDAALDQSAGPPGFVRAPGARIAPEQDDETPLSPHAEPRFAAQRAGDDALSEQLLATAFSRLDEQEKQEKPESSERDEMLDPQWPSARAEASEPPSMELPFEARPAEAEPKLDEPKHDEPKYSEPKYEPQYNEPKFEESKFAEPPQFEPKYEEPKYQEPAHVEPAPSQPADANAISILKAGVIDGMAYTLYSDGSIEAEMPQGTMRFASIDELRDYLEQTSG